MIVDSKYKKGIGEKALPKLNSSLPLNSQVPGGGGSQLSNPAIMPKYMGDARFKTPVRKIPSISVR